MKRSFSILALFACFLLVAGISTAYAGKPGNCTPTASEELGCDCFDGIDNDCDGKIDSKDRDCKNQTCDCTPSPEICTGGVDEDCDGLTDCADTADCSADPACQSARDVVVMATNDIGMHCACPGANYFLLLPPFNTLRAQVIERGALSGGTPKVLSDPNDVTVTYNVVENTDANLKADPHFADWIDAAPKLFPGFQPVRADGKVQGLTGSTLDGEMHAQPEGWWEAVGIPAFPDVSSNSTNAEKIMTDPFGDGPNRNPYLTGNVKVYDNATGGLLAETNTVVPVAFGGCCACHLQVTADHGYAATPENSFLVMGQLHERDSGINIAQMDPDGDGTMGPVRCSQCHLDPAMGESSPPGYSGYPKSVYTLSDVLHRFHVQNSVVLTQYDPDLANDCYQCHPGNNVDCYRGHHVNKTIGNKKDAHKVWCSDCHGDLNQRVAENQMANPWSVATLPRCQNCHSATGENATLGVFGGSFLNSIAHKNDKILCSTCHGEPHALYPSTFAKDNAQNIALQNDDRAIGVCDVCHVGKSTKYGKPMH